VSRQHFTANDFVELVAQVLAEPVYGVRITRRETRLYSDVWFLRVDTKDGTKPLVVKSWESDAAFEKQVRLLENACTIFSNDKDVCIPYLGCLKQERLLIMPQVLDPNIASFCRFSLQRPIRVRYLHHKTIMLEAACVGAGSWLREWHAETRNTGPLGSAFDAYFSSRTDLFAVISRKERDQILALTGNDDEVVMCAPHGDFTPPNLLWAPGRLTVLDFGLSEWEQMTPWWDYISMEIGLVHALQFAVKGLGAWFPRLRSLAIDAFRSGYGPMNCELQAKNACLAVRHLVLYASDFEGGKQFRRRAEWHKSELQRVLAHAFP